MTDRSWIEPIIERVVTQVLESHTGQLRTEIVRRVMEEIAAAPAPAAKRQGADSSALARHVTEIQLGTSQKEILKALLDSCAHYAARVALFVVKGSNATGWLGWSGGREVRACAGAARSRADRSRPSSMRHRPPLRCPPPVTECERG